MDESFDFGGSVGGDVGDFGEGQFSSEYLCFVLRVDGGCDCDVVVDDEKWNSIQKSNSNFKSISFNSNPNSNQYNSLQIQNHSIHFKFKIIQFNLNSIHFKFNKIPFKFKFNKI